MDLNAVIHGRVVDGPGLRSCLQGGLPDTQKARLAVAFWGDGAMDDLRFPTHPRNVEILCNLKMGGTNPFEIRSFMKAGAKVLQSDKLHAKIYLLDRFGAVGSSNASTNGLSLDGGEAAGWDEANVLFGPGELYDQAEHLYRRFREAGRAIREADLTMAESAWNDRRRTMFKTVYRNGGQVTLTYSEWIVLLDVCHRHHQEKLTAKHDAVALVSHQLQNLAFPDGKPPDSFRTREGLRGRIKVLRSFDPNFDGTPPPHVPEIAKTVWKRYGNDPQGCREAAEQILSALE